MLSNLKPQSIVAEIRRYEMYEAIADPANGKIDADVAVRMAGVDKWYGTFQVLRDINLTVHRGERIVVCGPSGSGKSTMIRCINRLEEHHGGSIIVDGVELVRRRMI